MTMDEGVATETTTARTVLFGGSGGEDTAAAFEQAFSVISATEGSGRRLGLLSAAGRTMVQGELSKVAGHLFDMPVGAALRRAWASHRLLIAAARQTLAAPGSEEVIELDLHRATATYHPFVQLMVDQAVVRTVRFELVLNFDVLALLAIVRDGDLVAFRTGECSVTATLSCDGVVLAGPRTTELVFPGTVWLDPPYRLASAVLADEPDAVRADREVI